ncbi:MAG: hypothetical protein HY996_03250 [Micrococcales bacterium]|nr:hypothetical protein [Micrococcales bacterium]
MVTLEIPTWSLTHVSPDALGRCKAPHVPGGSWSAPTGPGTRKEGWHAECARRSSLVARRSSLVAVTVALLSLFPSLSAALDLSPNAQIGISRSSLTLQSYTVWARRSDGRLVSRRQKTPGDFVWTVHDEVDDDVGPYGVAATSWFGASGAPVYEWVAYVNESGNLVVRSFTNGIADMEAAYAGPDGQNSPTGPVAITTALEGPPEAGTRYVRVYVTTAQNRLYSLRFDPADPGNPDWLGPIQTAVSLTNPIAATVATDDRTIRVFMTSTGDHVLQRRFQEPNWILWDLGATPGGGGCGTIAVAQGRLDTYTVVLYCAKTNPANDRIYRAVASGWITANPAWQGSFALPPGNGSVLNTGYAIAATAQPSQTSPQSMDGWVVGSNGKLWHFARKPGQTWQGPADLGWDLETEARSGGLAASPREGGATFVYFAGKVQEAYRLYRRVGSETYSASLPSNWANHQIGDPVHMMTDETNDHAESTTAFYRGRAMIAAVVFNGGNPPTSLSTVETAYSSDDGDSWSEPAVPDQLSGIERLVDPSLDFSDDGTAHLVVRGEDYDAPQCGAGMFSPQRVLHLTSTNGGASWSPTTRIDTGSDGDHPFHRIERRGGVGQDDLIHFVWKDETNAPQEPDPDPYVVDYRFGTWNGASLTLDLNVHPLSDPNRVSSGFKAWPAAPTLSVGKGGATWVAWLDLEDPADHGDDTFHVCRINAARDGCTGPDLFAGVNGSATVLADRAHIPFRGRPRIPLAGGGNDEHIKTSENWSIRASQSDSSKLYLAFSRHQLPDPEDPDPPEPEFDDPVDVYFSLLTYSDNGTGDETDDTITVSDPYPVSNDVGVYDDDTDQFMPQVTTTLGAWSQETISVAWYDRSVDCETPSGVYHNRCYRIRRSVSFNGGTLFLYTQNIAPPVTYGPDDFLSDPHCLPRLCGGTVDGSRFVGDYNEVVGDSLHSVHVMVRSRTPDECEVYGDEYSFVTSGWISPGYWYYP